MRSGWKQRCVHLLARSLAASGVAFAPSGCAGSGAGTDHDLAVPAGDFDELVRATCQYYAACEPDRLRAWPGGDIEGCFQVQRCDSSISIPLLDVECLSGMPGHCSLVRALTGSCDVSALSRDTRCSPTCETGEYCEVRLDRCPVCRPIPARGEPCTFYCAQGSVCAGDGTCQEPRGLDEACTHDEACESGHCRGGLCSELSDVNEPCDDHEDCVPTLGCIANRCAARADEGDTCKPDLAWYPCREGLACVDGVCTRAVCGTGEEGDVCVSGRCGRGMFCSRETGRCEPHRPLAGMCRVSEAVQSMSQPEDSEAECGPSLFCDASERCAPLREEGDACDGTLECKHDLRCALSPTDDETRSCRRLKSDGEPCEEPEECEAHFCIEGSCGLGACR